MFSAVNHLFKEHYFFGIAQQNKTQLHLTEYPEILSLNENNIDITIDIP